MSYTLLLLTFALVCSRDALAQVAGSSINVLEGGTTTLPCKLTTTLTPNENLEQISWQRRTRGKPLTDNFFTITKDDARLVNGPDRRFKYIGTFAEHNGTLQLSNANVFDAGTYTCIFSIFPSGQPRIVVEITVSVPLQTSVNSTQPTLGNKEVPLVTCTAAGFNPPAKVSWQTDDRLKDKVTWTNNSTLQISDTTTTVSTLFGKPTKEINGNKVQCVIISEKRNVTLPFEIQIYYPPLTVNIKKQSDGLVFTCEAEGNPKPTIIWSRSGNTLPPSVSATSGQGATLRFEKKSPTVAGLYQCEANNTYGSNQSFFYMDLSSETSCLTSWILFIILFLIVLAAGLAAFLHKRGFVKLPRFLRFDREAVRTSSPDDAANENASL
ncbi:poliovirus receptor homolog [Xiphophorus maculatus]|uniref:Poliovirus receptor homolog n=1 Tax=Xiphophorus maculatus TaxID=8083 RepID=A0A3B5PXR5_XIPMA|nr:poliovirus receptor homolog [Xiphophorus maculatus]